MSSDPSSPTAVLSPNKLQTLEESPLENDTSSLILHRNRFPLLFLLLLLLLLLLSSPSRCKRLFVPPPLPLLLLPPHPHPHPPPPLHDANKKQRECWQLRPQLKLLLQREQP